MTETSVGITCRLAAAYAEVPQTLGGYLMLRTALCDVLGIDVPIILAAMGGTASSAEFAAAASNEGALGSIASLFRTNAAIKRDVDVVKELTNRNFAVNHIPPMLDADAFRHTLAA